MCAASDVMSLCKLTLVWDPASLESNHLVSGEDDVAPLSYIV